MLDGNGRCERIAAQRPVFGKRVSADVVAVSAVPQMVRIPKRSDAEDVSHLVQNDVRPDTAGEHACDVRGVERHLSVGRQVRSAANKDGAGLPQNIVGTVDRRDGRVDDEVIDGLIEIVLGRLPHETSGISPVMTCSQRSAACVNAA